MPNRNRNVVMAYFASAEKADEAASQLKSWDQANEGIKLGGIGILVMNEGKIETRRVGARMTSAGAKAGAKAGAIVGVVAAILSSGASLIGSAVVGAVGGSVLGAMRHKGLGLTDSDLQQMMAQLSGGKAALVVMADDHELSPTKTQLLRLGGLAVSYAVPAVTMTEVEKAADGAHDDGAGSVDPTR